MQEVSLIEEYFDNIKHFRVAKPYLHDLEVLYFAAYNYDTPQLVDTLAPLTHKYKKTIDLVGKLLTGVITINDKTVYYYKDDYDIRHDTFYLMRCIVIEAAVTCGLEPSVKAVVSKIKTSNYDLNDIYLDMYDDNF